MSNEFVRRHEIDPDVVAMSVAASIAYYEKRRGELIKDAEKNLAIYEADTEAAKLAWHRVPEGGGWVGSYIDGRISKERDHYSKVRVIEHVSEPLEEKRFFLVYGDEPDVLETAGTGGFTSIEEAQGWFSRQGR